MMCYKPKEQFHFDIDLHAAKNHAFKLAYFTLVEKLAMKWGVGHLLKRSIMKNEIDALIEMTITQIKTAIESKKPGEAKVYTEILNLLKQTKCIEPRYLYNKPFELKNFRQILDAPLTDRKQNG